MKPPEAPRRAVPVAVLLLAALTLTAYGPALRAGFVNIDDPTYVTANPAVRGGLSLAGLRWAFTSVGHASNWHPLTWLSHQADVTFFGMRPGLHHLTSLLLHLASTVLLWVVWQSLTGAEGQALLVAALFAVHPLHVESVAWVAERKDVLLGVLFMLAIRSYLQYLRRPRPARLAALTGFHALALLAKPMAVSLPAILLILDWWPLGRWRRGATLNLLREKAPLFLLSAASAGITLAAQSRGGSLVATAKVSILPRIANAAVACAVYLKQLVWPVDLAVFYPFPENGIPSWQVAAAVLLLATVSGLALATARSRPALAAGWLWYLTMLLPVAGIVQVGSQARADRYTYLPLIGIFMALAAAAGRPAATGAAGRRILAVIGVILIPLLAWGTWRQTGYWRDSRTLFTHALAVTRDNWFAENNLGAALSDAGEEDAARSRFVKALAIEPDYPEAHQNLATSLLRSGRLEEAELHYRASIRLRPGYAKARNNLATLLQGRGDPAGALEQLRAAIAVDPSYADARFNLARLLEMTGQRNEAQREYRELLLRAPGDAEARARLDVIEGRRGQ